MAYIFLHFRTEDSENSHVHNPYGGSMWHGKVKWFSQQSHKDAMEIKVRVFRLSVKFERRFKNFSTSLYHSPIDSRLDKRDPIILYYASSVGKLNYTTRVAIIATSLSFLKIICSKGSTDEPPVSWPEVSVILTVGWSVLQMLRSTRKSQPKKFKKIPNPVAFHHMLLAGGL